MSDDATPPRTKVHFVAGEVWARRWDRAPVVGDKVVLGTDRYEVAHVEDLGRDRFRAFVTPSPITVPTSTFKPATST